MRYFLLILCLLNIQFLSSQTFEVLTIKNSGDNDKRINLVILGDGYLETEFTKFETDATNFISSMFDQTPFKEYANYFNVHIIKVPSIESGASHPGTASDEPAPPNDVPVLTVNNYFGTSFDSYGFHRSLYTLDFTPVHNVLAANFPLYDVAMILVNSPYYGGSGGEFPIASTGTSASEIAIHELGHSFADLKDEYYPGDLLAEEGINMTQETDPSLVKWVNWMNSNGIGIYAYGTSGSAANWNRPHQSCKMRYLGYDFCSVCSEGLIEKIHDLVTSIDSFLPDSETVDNPSFPLAFNLNLIYTIPNTLETTWTLNSNPYTSNVDNVTLIENDITLGINTLTAVVSDESPLLRVDNHETIHVSTVTWSLNVTSLGIESISNETNDFQISLYPNPSVDIVKFKYESTFATNIMVEIISIDGKRVKSITLSDTDESQIDISDLSQGMYITKFYADNVLLATKKLIKK
jgi:hypothetical protein